MSGVVLGMNEEEDEDDVAGLLDGNDDDDDNDGDYEESKSRRKKYGRNKKPYAVVRTGTIGNLMNTFVLCCIFFGIVSTTNNENTIPTKQATVRIQYCRSVCARALKYHKKFPHINILRPRGKLKRIKKLNSPS